MSSVLSISGDTDGLRASECRHAVEHTRTNRYFGCLRADLASPQAGARKSLHPVHQSLGQRALVVATGLLPFTPAALRDCVDGGIAPGCAGRAGWPRRRTFTRRDRRDSPALLSAHGTPWCRRHRRHRWYRLPRQRESGRANRAALRYRLRLGGSSARRRSGPWSRQSPGAPCATCDVWTSHACVSLGFAA